MFKRTSKTNSMIHNGRYFVILAAMRTGSNLLQSNLNQYDDILCLGELFNGGFVGVNIPGRGEKPFAGFNRGDTALRDKDTTAFFNTIYAAAGNNILGFRLFRGHNDGILDIVLRNKNCKKIILKRNMLDSFISLRIANKSNRWLSGSPDGIQDDKVRFGIREFRKYISQTESFYSSCEKKLKSDGQEYFSLDYTDLKDTTKLNRLTAFVGSNCQKNLVEEIIYKQTTPELEHKVINYEEMITGLKENDLYHLFLSR